MDTYVPFKNADADEDDESMFLRATVTYLDMTSMMDLDSTGNVDERVHRDAGSDVPVAKIATTTSTGESNVEHDDTTYQSRLFRVSVVSANAVRVRSSVGGRANLRLPVRPMREKSQRTRRPEALSEFP